MRVLFATDGSKFSEDAVRKACEMLKGTDELVIRAISAAEYSSPIVSEQIVVSNDLFSRIAADARQASVEALDRVKEIIKKTLGEDQAKLVETAVITESPKSAIVGEAASWNADLIVVGSHGYGFWDRMLLGSVSDAVVHHAPCSVLIVRHTE